MIIIVAIFSWRFHLIFFLPIFYSTQRRQCVFRIQIRFPKTNAEKIHRYQFAIVIVGDIFSNWVFFFSVKDFFNDQNSTIQILCCCYFSFHSLSIFLIVARRPSPGRFSRLVLWQLWIVLFLLSPIIMYYDAECWTFVRHRVVYCTLYNAVRIK